MTIKEAIDRIDSLKHNTYSSADKIAWLSELDWSAKTLVIDLHEGSDDVTFEGYTSTTPTDTELLIPPPFDSIYLHWLAAQIDYYNGEYDKYNAAIALYNALYDAYSKNYTTNHMPRSQGCRFLF